MVQYNIIHYIHNCEIEQLMQNILPQELKFWFFKKNLILLKL